MYLSGLVALVVCVVYFALFFMPFRLYRLRGRPATDDGSKV
jgi:hypothetical protein